MRGKGVELFGRQAYVNIFIFFSRAFDASIPIFHFLHTRLYHFSFGVYLIHAVSCEAELMLFTESKQPAMESVGCRVAVLPAPHHILQCVRAAATRVVLCTVDNTNYKCNSTAITVACLACRRQQRVAALVTPSIASQSDAPARYARHQIPSLNPEGVSTL